MLKTAQSTEVRDELSADELNAVTGGTTSGESGQSGKQDPMADIFRALMQGHG